MPNTKTVVPFDGNKEQEKRLVEAINQHKNTPGALMPILQEAQEIYGYLPEEVQIMISCELQIPLTEIYGVVSFYSQFTLNPKGDYRVSVCMGTACYVKGAGDILDRVCQVLDCEAGSITEDGKFSIDATRCIGACGLAPVIMVNEDVYGRLQPDDVNDVLKKYLA